MLLWLNLLLPCAAANRAGDAGAAARHLPHGAKGRLRDHPLLHPLQHVDHAPAHRVVRGVQGPQGALQYTPFACLMGTMLSVSHGTHILLLDDAHVLYCCPGGLLHGH